MTTIEFLHSKFKIIDGPDPSKSHCKILINEEFGEKRFLKYPRDNSLESFKELIREWIPSKLHQSLGTFSQDPAIKNIGGKLGLILLYCDTNWNQKINNPELIIVNENEFALAFVCDFLIGQNDRPIGKPEHVGLKLLDDGKHRLILLDNGNWDPSQPDSYLEKPFIDSLFFANQPFTRPQLEEAVAMTRQKFYPSILMDEAARELLSESFWSIEQRELILRYCNQQIAPYLIKRIEKLDLLLQWYDETHAPEQIPQVPEINQIPEINQPVAAA